MLRKDSSMKLVHQPVGKGLLARTFRAMGQDDWQLWRGKAIVAFLSDAEHRELDRRQRRQPVKVYTDEPRSWWWYQGTFHWEDDSLTAEDVRVLLEERKLKKERQLDRARSRVETAKADPTSGREPIPDDVKMFVWQRDSGRCVKCGSQQELEYDHIIPVAMGGSNTARNLQLLCASCNREKGGHLV